MDPSFCELLERAKWLVNQMPLEASGRLPVELTLPEVLRETEKMHTRITGQMIDNRRAMLMFSQNDIDLQQLTRKVQDLDKKRIFQPDELPDTDVADFLQRHRQEAIFDIIEETNANIYKTIENRKWRSKFEEWDEEKQRLVNAFAQQYERQEASAKTTTATSCSAASVAATSSLNRIQMLYAKELLNYNKCQQPRMNLLNTFTQLAQQELNDAQVTKMWQVLQHMAKQSPLCRNVDAVKARMESPLFVQQALLHLELAYRQYIDGLLKRSRSASDCGGFPGVYHKVKRFVRLKVQEWLTLNGLVDVHRRRPLWPHVFYCLRCGHLPSAVQFLRDWGDPQPELREFLELQHQFKDNRQLQQHSSHLERLKLRLSNDYNERLRHSSDPFLKAVFALLLCCDPINPHCQVVQSMNDFVWSQLMLRRQLQPPLCISDLEGMMHMMYGRDYLQAASTIPIFFEVLVLSGHFEAAIEYLSRTDANEVHAVHMAIALNELSMVGIAGDEQDPLLSTIKDDASDLCRLNVMRLIIDYATRFENTNIIEAINYYYLLRHFQSKDGSNLMLQSISDFMLHNYKPQMVDLMFGKFDPKEPTFYTRGIFDQLPCGDFDKNALASKMAQELTRRCEYEAAIDMHLITGQLDKAMGLMCCLLAQMLHLNTPKENLRKVLSRLTNRLHSGSARATLNLSTNELVAFKLLSQLMRFFDRFHGGDYQQALEILDACELIPKNCAEIDFCVSKAKVLGADAVKVLPNILLSTMQIYFRQYKTQSAAKLILRERAKALINFAATVIHRLPPNTNMRLVKMELQMQVN
ncbi:hypothetical protein KR044_002278 [Drosophila immigrans]|nr:hypothetical protein KR044_002278 [Drosophila immigrans]